ncbi:MAG: CHAD domain-containing protein [Solirubrobacteraceae bacterium]
MSGCEFLSTDGTTPSVVGEALGDHLLVTDGGVRDSDRTYYDTFDGLLRDAGLLAAHEDGELTLVDRDSGAVRLRGQVAAPGQRLFPRELEPGPLRDALLDVVEERALLPLARVHARRRALSVLDDQRKTVVRMTLEEPALVDGAGRLSILRPRVRLAAVRGYDDELGEVKSALAMDLGLAAADQPLVDEAVRAAGHDPAGISSKISVPLLFEDRADAAAAKVLRRLLDVIEANTDGTIADIDSEFLHDYRVSVRRSRSVQRELKRVFSPEQLAEFRAEFRWLQQITGDSRDLDVYVLEFDAMRALVPEAMRRDLDPLLEVLRGRRLAARRQMVSDLRSQKVASLLDRWARFLDELEALDETDRPDASQPIGEVAGKRIRKVYRRMVKMGSAIDESSPAEDYHELRKRGKELRYLLELFGTPLYPEDVVKPMIKALKALQDVLGRHQDREVQIAMLSSLRDELASVRGGAAALMATGALVSRLQEDEQAARDEFAARFAAFAGKDQRKLVKATFG